MDADGSLQAAFAKLDVDKSGYLDHKELRKALASVGMALDSSKVRVRVRVRVRIRVRDTFHRELRSAWGFRGDVWS